MAEKISIANHSGGTAKTTSAIGLGYALAARGKRVLLVDLDFQMTLTTLMGAGAELGTHTLKEVFDGKAAIGQTVGLRDGIAFTRGSPDFVGADYDYASRAGREFILSKAMRGIEDHYDYIILDSPGSLGFMTMNGMTYADWVIIPAIAEPKGIAALAQILESIDVIKETVNTDLELLGVGIVKYEGRYKQHRSITEMYRRQWGDIRVFNTPIPQRAEVINAQSDGRPLGKDISKAYSDWADEIEKTVNHG